MIRSNVRELQMALPGRALMQEGCRHAQQPVLAQVFLTAEYLAIAMEYAAGGDMYHRVVHCRGLHEADARWYFQQLIIAIDYCHRMVCIRTE